MDTPEPATQVPDGLLTVRSAVGYSLAFFVLVCALVLHQYVTTGHESSLQELRGQLSEDKKLLISVAIARSETLATWSLGLMAALAFMFNYFRDRRPTDNTSLLWGATITFILAFTSIFYSQVFFDKLSGLVLERYDPFSSDNLIFVSQLQYFFLVASVVGFVAVSFFLLTSVPVKESEKR
jgi:magnesium-transporting ATPase (P-type)